MYCIYSLIVGIISSIVYSMFYNQIMNFNHVIEGSVVYDMHLKANCVTYKGILCHNHHYQILIDISSSFFDEIYMYVDFFLFSETFQFVDNSISEIYLQLLYKQKLAIFCYPTYFHGFFFKNYCDFCCNGIIIQYKFFLSFSWSDLKLQVCNT